MTFPCFNTPLRRVAHLVTWRWRPTRLVVCRLSVCQIVCQPAYEFIRVPVGVHSREMYMCVTVF